MCRRVVRQVGVSGLLALHEDDVAEDLDEDVGNKTKKAADLNRTKEGTGRQTCSCDAC